MNVSSGAIYLCALLISTVGSAADLKQSRFTQVINDVKVLELTTKQTKKASVNEVFNLPDVIRTGPGSRAELVAEDRTITRIGANSIFSFDPSNRTISLEKGSLLFQAPKGKGGGTIRTTSAAASVLGTTMIIAATDDGGFKVLLLEGSGRVTLPNGKSVTLKPGQMIFVLPNGEGFSPVITFGLGEQVEGSLLVNGFDNELPSMNLINLQITKQNKLIANGRAVDTGLLVGDHATPQGVQVIDPSLLQELFEQVSHAGGPTGPGPDPVPPIDPPIDPPVDPVVPPIQFDLIIGSALLDNDDLQYNPNFGHFMQGNNVLVDAETVDMSMAAGDPTLYIDVLNIMQFADNASHSTTFLGGGSFQFPQAHVVGEGSVDELFLSAGDFIFPNEFTLIFDGNYFSLNDLNDMNLSSTSENGLRIENPTPEGSLILWAAGNLTLSGNVRISADSLALIAGNNIAINGSYLGFYSAHLAAENRLTLRDVGFSGSAGFISMSAKTIVLENILFPSGSFVYLLSEFGQLASNPNTGAAVVPGMVNFVRDVYYGSTANPAQNEVGNNIFIGSPNSEVSRLR
ncbi:MAG: FecR domain-containing protein [Verrucomicrobia bacterium]|nr:FecR domain-containing protein [Verrucomicrobiota bacterium]